MDLVDAFPSLPVPAPAPQNPWKQTTIETQLALRDERSTVSMTDNPYATSLASMQSDLASMVTSIMTLNEQQRAEDRKQYEEREADREAQRKIVDDKQTEWRRDDLRRMEKLEERGVTTTNAILQMMQQMCQGTGLLVQQPPSQATATVPILVPPQPQTTNSKQNR